MGIDLNLLYSHTEDSIDITGKYDIPKSYYENSNVLDLKNVEVCGKISLVSSDDDYSEEVENVKCNIKGFAIVEDSISLEPIEYEFNIDYDDEIEENCKSDQNSLDIFAFLWENIVLEVPLQFTKVTDLKKFRGEGWKLISEDDLVNTNNPFKELLKNQEKEE